MQELRRRPLLSLRRPHLDSDTYRVVLKIFSHCVEVAPHIPPSPPRISHSHPGPREQERSVSSGGIATFCAIPGEDGYGLGEAGDGSGREGQGGRSGSASLEDGRQGLGKASDVLANGCPCVADAQVGNSLVVEALGTGEVREEVCDDSRNGVSQQERPCGSPISSDPLDNFLVDFSSLIEELGLLEGEGEGKDELASDGSKNTLQLDDAGSLSFGEACPPVVAPEQRETKQGGTRVDGSLANESPVGDELPTELVCKDPDLLSLPAETPHSVEESCTETQLRVCDSSGLSTNGSGLRELGDHEKNIPICVSEDHEMEEGEIPNEGEIPDISFGLESQDAAKQGMQLGESHPADDSSEKGNVTHMVGAFIAKGATLVADVIIEGLKSTLHESDQFIGRVELKPQKKEKTAKRTKKSAGKTGKKGNLSSKQPNDDMGLEYQKKTKNAATTKDSISENIVSAHSSLAEVSLKDLAIQSDEKPSNTEDIKVQQKRKRAPLTENRKEKKKLAKKRKRAETNKKLGVKRLKLEMMSKPRKVIPCSFYQKGRCQKGDSCKFSHDIIPDTKNMPCTFFARGTCLKGDDCPFDHQLSKYPCHSYMSQGRCNRGDSCLFSHKIPVGELSFSAFVTSETDSTMLSGKQGLQKCLKSSNLSSSAVNTSMETTTTGAKSSMPKDPVEQMKLKQPVRMPKGICFLSFGKEPSIGINKQQHYLDLKKSGGIQIQKQEEKIVLGKPQNSNESLLTLREKSLSCRTLTSLVNEDKSLSLLQKAPLLVQQNVELKSCESIQPLRSNTTSSNGSKDFANEESIVTDACRILEKFLFSDIA